MGHVFDTLFTKRIFPVIFFLVVYETMFAKREGWQGLDRSELLKYFNDCGHFPTHQQIDEVWDLVLRGECFLISFFLSLSSPFFFSCPLSSLVLSFLLLLLCIWSYKYFFIFLKRGFHIYERRREDDGAIGREAHQLPQIF